MYFETSRCDLLVDSMLDAGKRGDRGKPLGLRMGIL
jgi:hypothetical protein